MVLTAKREKKVPVEDLQATFLEGVAEQETKEEMAEKLQVDQVVIATEVPHMEKVVFRNQRDPGYPLEFHFKSKAVPFKMYKLIDGQTYDLPREVIKNLESCRENIHKYRKNGEGIPEVYIAGYKTHFVCERI